MHTHLCMFAVGIHPEGRDEGVVGMVEHAEETLVERQSSTKHRSNDDVVLWKLNVEFAEWSDDVLWGVFERLRNFEGHVLADAFNVVTEQQAVLLIVDIAKLRHVAVHHRVLFVQVNGFHAAIMVYVLDFWSQRYE